MIDITKIFTNHFDSEHISDDRMKAFSEDHINKLTGWLTIHVDAELSTMLTDLVTKHTAYFGAISSEDTKMNMQQNRTKAADNAWTAVMEFIRDGESAIRYKWGKDSPEYQEFYPHGLDEYHNATKLNKETLANRYVSAATAHVADLPAGFEADISALKTDWKNKFTAQQTQIGLVKDANSQTASSRDTLEVQLMLHMLIIGSKNIGQPDKVNDFFNQSLLRPQKENIPAHSIVIRGKITYGIGTPVVGATVSVQGDNPPAYSTETDEHGKYEFRFDNIADGENSGTLTVTAQGFQVHTQPIAPEFGKVTVVNVTLTQQMQIAASSLTPAPSPRERGVQAEFL